MTKEPLKSVMLHRPLQPTRLVSTPLDTDGGAPGTMKDSTFASHVPATSLKIACSGPGLGMGGMPCAAARAGQAQDDGTDDDRALPASSLRPPCVDRLPHR